MLPSGGAQPACRDTLRNDADKDAPKDMGFNYLPTVTLIEDFRPYWITNTCSYERMKADILTMRALNARFVRFHLIPTEPNRDAFPGVDPAKLLDEVDRAADFAAELGMRGHMDLWAADILRITEQEVIRRVERLKGIAGSYQFGNETYHISGNYERCFGHVLSLATAAKAADPSCRVMMDLLPQDLAYAEENVPELFETLDVIPIHFYAMSDYRGWDQVYLDQLVHYCGAGDGSFVPPSDRTFIQHRFYELPYNWPDREKWITETTSSGYHRFSHQAPDHLRAAAWRKIRTAAANRTAVATLAHHCFREQMGWREFGTSLCGIIRQDGSPKEVAIAFKEEALKHLPSDDTAKWVTTTMDVNGDSIEATLKSSSSRRMAGTLTFEASDIDLRSDPEKGISIAPGRHTVVVARYDRDSLSPARSTRVFAVFRSSDPEYAGSAAVGQAVVRTEAPIDMELHGEPFPGVSFPHGTKEVLQFLREYPGPGILTGDLLGFDAEMAHRLKLVLQALTGRESETAADAPRFLSGTDERRLRLDVRPGPYDMSLTMGGEEGST